MFVQIKLINSYLKRVLGAAAVPLLRVDIWELVHAGRQINLYVTPTDGLYLIHGHGGGRLVHCQRFQNKILQTEVFYG